MKLLHIAVIALVVSLARGQEADVTVSSASAEGVVTPQTLGKQCIADPPALSNGYWLPFKCWGVNWSGTLFPCKGICNSGFIGNPSVKCNSTGQWSAVTGSCVKGCQGSPDWAYNAWSWPLTCKDAAAGATCTTSCKSGFKGNLTAACQANGKWAVTGTCTKVKSAAADATAAYADSDATATAAAAEPTAVVTESSQEATAEPAAAEAAAATATASVAVGQTFSTGKKSCQTAPPKLTDGFWLADCKLADSDGATCYGGCNLGFWGKPTVQCRNGTWTAISGACIKHSQVACWIFPQWSVSRNGYGSWPESCWWNRDGAVCTATCSTGYTGTVTTTCQASGLFGKWTTATGKCTKISGASVTAGADDAATTAAAAEPVPVAIQEASADPASPC